ncbi:TPA: glycosyltransferase [Streptococcus suis]
MKVAFIFDTVLVENDSDFYGMTLNYDFFASRYLSMFDSMIVSTRVVSSARAKGDVFGYKIVNGPSVEVIPIRTYRDIPDAIRNRKKIIGELEEVIAKSDKVIIRMPSVLGMFATQICKKLKKDYLIELVACPWDGYINHTNPIGKLLAPIMYFKTKGVVSNAPNVLYVTNDFLQRRYPTNGKSCGCSDVVLNEINDLDLQSRLNKINSLDFDKKIILGTVANVGMKYKGHRYVFEAVYELKKLGKDFEYRLIGNGDQKRLRTLVKKLGLEQEVIFLGSLPHKEVFEELKAIDVYIQPSLQEGLPRAVVEAMSLACPVIGSNVGGIPELISQDMLFKKKNSNQLANIIENLTKEKLIIEAMNNFGKAKEFEDKKLTKIRQRFYSSF